MTGDLARRRSARPSGPPRADVADRVRLALSRGKLAHWLLFESAEEVAAARALIRVARARHLEALTPAEMRARQAEARTLIIAGPQGPGTAAPGPDLLPTPPVSARSGAARPGAARRRAGEGALP